MYFKLVYVPPYTIHIGAIISVGIAFFTLRDSFIDQPGRFGLSFFIITFLMSQFIGGALVGYFVD
jgi:hypothetical protein